MRAITSSQQVHYNVGALGKRLAAPANSLPLFSACLQENRHYTVLQENRHHEAIASSSGTDHKQLLRQAEGLLGKNLWLTHGIPAKAEQSHRQPLRGHVGTELTISRSECELEQVRGERRAETRAGQDWLMWIM